MRRRARRLLLFCVVMGIWCLVFEAALRQWGSSEAAPAFQGLFTGDPVIGYRLQPGARTRFTTAEFDTEIAINSAGVRDDEEIGPKAPNEKRILVLGDSLVLSVQVPFSATFTELLEQRLNSDRSPEEAARYRVINAGVQGYGPVEQLLFFREALRTLRPDIVVVSVFVGNDAEEALTSQPKLSPARPAAERLGEWGVTHLRRTVRRSMVLQVLRLRIRTATDRFRSTAPPEPPLQTYAAHPAPRIAEGIALTREAVAQIATIAGQDGARTAIVLMPARFQLDHGDYGRLRAIVQQAGGELQRDAATARFSAALADLQLPMLDLLPALRAAPPGPDLFFQENVHLTLRGHRVVSDALAEFLRDRALLDR
jgi:lysophospholipase L1-like esterase